MSHEKHNQFQQHNDQPPHAGPSRLVQIPLDFPVSVNTTAEGYSMHVKLPGRRNDYSYVRVNVGPLGVIHVEGVLGNPEILQELARKTNLNEREMAVSGDFCLPVRLPGRIVSEPLKLELKPDGELEALFRKDIYGDPWPHWTFTEDDAQV